jgi:NTE family protein
MSHRRSRFLVVVAAASFLSMACAYPKTAALQKWDLKQGYRFPLTATAGAAEPPKNSEQLFVVLAFSGGGTRAAALSYGVLHELERIRFHWNEQTGAAEACAAGDQRCRSLLDEVDVISSVSGGSFTSAYYAFRGKQIFDSADAFNTRFLYAPVQRELFARAIHYPQYWPHLGARVEIAAKEHASRLFGDSTFAALERTRPYVILNGTDMSTGARFEFTQDQFDLICGNLSAFPIARAVAASSAFPGLLNSMTIDTHTGQCEYSGPGTNKLQVDWVDQSVTGRAVNYRRYKAGRDVAALLDEDREHLHILDGGLADNIGVRAALRSLSSIDAPMDAGGNVSGWSLLTRINTRAVRHIIVIGVNAKTEKTTTWDERSAGPGTLAVFNRATGIPMSSFTAETLDLLREYADDAVLNQAGRPKFHAFEVAFENIPDESERQFFLNMPTTFELSRHEVDCLKARGGSLLRDALSIEHQGKTFDQLTTGDLHGRLEGDPLP